VFLDGIGELPGSAAGAARRAGAPPLHRVGGAEPIDVDVRVLAATNRDLRGEVNAGAFRADLYFRLAVARLTIPPLRERADDLEPLVIALAERFTGVAGDNPLAHALPALRQQRWPGNVRELRNVVEAALVLGPLPGAAGALGNAAGDPDAPGALASYRRPRPRR
jgi:transcriptional regulator with GAF, ATPase, and Fis domain